MDSFWIILTGSLVAVSCALLGTFLILRKMSMVGDAISHSVLPGIVIAFFIAGSMQSIWMLVGAGIIGVLTTFLIEFFHQKGRLQTDASIGVTFTWLFALGVILVTYYAGNAHIDQDCILYGEIAYVPIDLIYDSSGNPIGPKAVIILAVVLLLIVSFIIAFYKELFITTFDASYAKAIGIATNKWHYALMGLVSLTTVASFESVGAILVVALLIAPAASAYLITHQLKLMLVLSALFGILSSIGGYWLSYLLDGSIAGAMVTVSGFIFAICYLIVRMRKLLFASVVLLLSGCYNQLALDGFDNEKWANPDDCSEYRLEIADYLIENQEVLLEGTQNEVESLLGQADEHELYQRNQKFFHYRLTPSEECGDYETLSFLSIRFNAIGRANLVQVMLRENGK